MPAESKEVEMEPATPTKAAAEPEPEPKSPEETVVASAQSSLELIERSVTTKEQRFFSRAMRQTAGARKKMSPAAIKAVLGCLPESELKQLCLDRVAAAPAGDASMDVDGAAAPKELDVSGLAVPVVECEVYLFIVAVQFLLDKKCVDAAFEVSSSVLAYCEQQNRRSLDALHSTVWFYHSLISPPPRAACLRSLAIAAAALLTPAACRRRTSRRTRCRRSDRGCWRPTARPSSTATSRARRCTSTSCCATS
jgi:hypothetical protein